MTPNRASGSQQKSPETVVRELADIEAIKQLKSMYCYLVDERRWDDLAQLLTEDAVGDYGFGAVFRGRDVIMKSFFHPVPESYFFLHVLNNPVVKVSGDSATGQWYTTVPSAVVVTVGASRSETKYSGEVKARHETTLAFRVGGKLVSRLVEVGQAVEAGQVVAAGQPVLRLARPDEKDVVIAVPENRIGQLLAADVLSISLWAYPDSHYDGRIREVAPVADPVTRTYAVRVSIIEADAKVLLGMTANVLLGRAEEFQLALIPATAVFQQGDHPAVWVIAADGKVSLRPVDVAAFREDGAAIRGGLTAGETVRFHP